MLGGKKEFSMSTVFGEVENDADPLMLELSDASCMIQDAMVLMEEGVLSPTRYDQLRSYLSQHLESVFAEEFDQ